MFILTGISIFALFQIIPYACKVYLLQRVWQPLLRLHKHAELIEGSENVRLQAAKEINKYVNRLG